MSQLPSLSDGSLLNGRVAYAQPHSGYRTGIEPVLLAASIPARPGEHVIEAGTGAGAGLLTLAARVDGIFGLGLERDRLMAAIAAQNLAANAFTSIRIAQQDVVGWAPDRAYHHAFANPPWHGEDGTPSPIEGRQAAKMAAPGLLQNWARALAAGLRHRGTLSLILPAAALSQGMLALAEAGCAETTLQPLWPRRGQPAKIVILRGVYGGRGPCRVLPGLVLHNQDGTYTEEAERILRAGEALAL